MQKNKKYFITLTGAKKNIGDFLITDRAIALLKHCEPSYDYISRPNWKAFDDLDEVNSSEGVIILGGPGVRTNMYPDIYKLAKDLDQVEVPIFSIGVGWKGLTKHKIVEKNYSFTADSKILLRKMNCSNAGISCRGHYTVNVLNNSGFGNTVMTGCPVWYDIESLNNKFKVPESVEYLLYTPAQQEQYASQSADFMDYLKSKFPNSKIVVSFHRGIGQTDEFTPQSDAKNTATLAEHAKKLGFDVIDVSGDISKIKCYDEFDIHIGYRVHAHTYFLSKRIPSILINEDGRGNEFAEALISPSVDAYHAPIPFIFKNKIAMKFFRRFLTINKKAVTQLDKIIDEQFKNRFEEYNKCAEVIDKTFHTMKEYIHSLVK